MKVPTLKRLLLITESFLLLTKNKRMIRVKRSNSDLDMKRLLKANSIGTRRQLLLKLLSLNPLIKRNCSKNLREKLLTKSLIKSMLRLKMPKPRNSKKLMKSLTETRPSRPISMANLNLFTLN